jgi:predicted flavoprotein YhiN
VTYPIRGTHLVIIGGGAAGLMGACLAGELGIPTLLLERKHRLGSKLLMCGNGRCNLSWRLEPAQMLADFGTPLDAFLQPAIQAFSPAMLMRWFESRGLPLMTTSDGKVFPRSERAPDVVHCFQDQLRELGVALCMQSPVETILPLEGGGFCVQTGVFSFHAQHVLLTTGGVSYPKTGSVGDGQRMAGEMGLRVLPFRPGLVGVEWADPWVQRQFGKPFKQAVVRVFDGQSLLGETQGLLEVERWGLGGGCISNATRLLSRAGAKHPVLEIKPAPGADVIRIESVKMRPLKEAMVTVGGVDLAEVSNTTMEARRVPGLFLAGEVLDIDGPTGGYNLTAAFATARLAVQEIARRTGGKRTEDRRLKTEDIWKSRSSFANATADKKSRVESRNRGPQPIDSRPQTSGGRASSRPNAQRPTKNEERRTKNVRRRPR